MNLRQSSLIASFPRTSSPKEIHQNPDSSSSIDITDVDEKQDIEENKLRLREDDKKSGTRDEGVNLTVHKGRKAAVTLVRQKEEVTSSDRDGVKAQRSVSARHSDVWRPY